MLGLSRSAIIRLIDLGFVNPARGPRQSYRFSFRDVVLLRTAQELRAARIPTSRILRSLKRLQEELPAGKPLSGLRITAVGNNIAVRERNAQWEAETGQLLMDFDVAVDPGSVMAMEHLPQSRRTAATAETPQALFERAEALEGVDDAGAIRLYRQALAAAPDFTNASLNLGAMLCEKGQCAEAVTLYDHAIERRPGEPLLHYNRAVALEDLARTTEALKAYEEALRLDPDLADAHYNLARLHSELGHGQKALRHLSAYRRLQR